MPPQSQYPIQPGDPRLFMLAPGFPLSTCKPTSLIQTPGLTFMSLCLLDLKHQERSLVWASPKPYKTSLPPGLGESVIIKETCFSTLWQLVEKLSESSSPGNKISNMVPTVKPLNLQRELEDTWEALGDCCVTSSRIVFLPQLRTREWAQGNVSSTYQTSSLSGYTVRLNSLTHKL